MNIGARQEIEDKEEDEEQQARVLHATIAAAAEIKREGEKSTLLLSREAKSYVIWPAELCPTASLTDCCWLTAD